MAGSWLFATTFVISSAKADDESRVRGRHNPDTLTTDRPVCGPRHPTPAAGTCRQRDATLGREAEDPSGWRGPVSLHTSRVKEEDTHGTSGRR
jgi:hypothetical protein